MLCLVFLGWLQYWPQTSVFLHFCLREADVGAKIYFKNPTLKGNSLHWRSTCRIRINKAYLDGRARRMLTGRWQICCLPANPGSAILAETGPSQGDRIIYSSSQEVETLCGMHNNVYGLLRSLKLKYNLLFVGCCCLSLEMLLTMRKEIQSIWNPNIGGII